MEKVTVKCKTAVYGNVRAELLWANEPMSFWGTVDPQSGLIRDNRHALYMKNMAGKVLAFTTPKGQQRYWPDHSGADPYRLRSRGHHQFA